MASIGHQLGDSKQGRFEVGALTTGTTTRSCKTFSVLKNEVTIEAATRFYRDDFSPRSNSFRDMFKVGVNLFFLDTQAESQVSATHLIDFQQFNYLLAQRLHRFSPDSGIGVCQ